MACVHPLCDCPTIYDRPECRANPTQEFCDSRTIPVLLSCATGGSPRRPEERWLRCDWEYSYMIGMPECNTCGATRGGR